MGLPNQAPLCAGKSAGGLQKGSQTHWPAVCAVNGEKVNKMCAE